MMLPALLLAGLTAQADAPAVEAGVPVASIRLVAGRVESARRGGQWTAVEEGDAFRTGDALRTGPDGAARVEFPWMGTVLGPDTVLRVPSGRILATVLESGRVELVSDGEIVKLLAGNLDIRGQGRIVVRHDGKNTAVMSLTDVAEIGTPGGGRLVLQAGEAARQRNGGKVEGPLPLPPAPRIVSPAGDPLYVQPATPVPLQWAGEAGRYIVELVPLDADTPLLASESASTYAEVRVPWLGLYRWRVTGIQASGLETAPSEEGLICVVEK